MTRSYVPDTGDIIWLTFNPHVGREQGGRRPALVLSPKAYNGRAQLALACPITSRAKGYPFEVALPAGAPVTGVALTDQIKSIDWLERRAEYAGKADEDFLVAVQERIRPLLGL